jgi:DNA mismatch repair protein MutS
MLLTGPNMSGKSTFLKAISLCVYLAHVGVAVPTAEASMPFFDTLSVSINLNDDLQNGQSHFMTEVKNLKSVALEAADNKRCFCVFDELFRGTNIEDAIEISTSTLNGLTQFKNSYFFISTHLHQLKEIQSVKDGKVDMYYIDCEIQDNTPKFTYVLKQGWSDLRVGRILFEKEGLNELLLSPNKPVCAHNTTTLLP